MLGDMEMTDAFDAQIRVPPINTLAALDHVLREVALFSSERDHRRCLDLLGQSGFGEEGKLNVGVKKLLSLVEMARQDPEPVETFTANLVDYAA